MSGVTRRTFLHAAGAASLVSYQLASTTLDHADATPTVPAADRREPAGTEIRSIDGTGVVLQYGVVVPAFDGWRTDEPTRDYRSLDGTWRFRFDPDDDGERAGWHRLSFDDSSWDEITVPSAWDLLDTPGFGSYDGTDFGQGTAFADGYAWYRTTVQVPGHWSRRHVRLNFLAVNYRADVWVNGRFVGTHEGGHTPFSIPLHRPLRPGPRNVIAVRVHRRASYEDYTQASPEVTDPYAIPWKPVDYWPYAGITRSAWLEASPQVHVTKVLLDARDGELDARAVVENHTDRSFTGQVVFDPGAGSGGSTQTVPVTVAAGGIAVVRARIDIPDAPTWTPARARLLTCTATLRAVPAPVVDQLRSTYGVRTVEVSGTQLLVNGAPMFLKGVNWHEESVEHGRSMTHAAYERELRHVVTIGANLIRNSVYNRDPYVYDWADRNGVLVMDDTDNMWVNTAQERLQTEEYGLSRAMAATMAWNQHNHPSVVLWCLQNESEIDGADGAVYRAWLADMKAAVNAVDLARRPVTWASSTTHDPAFDIADVIGFNEYFGYFYGDNADLGPAIDDVHARYPDRPIVITENGTWSLPGQHGPETEEGTEEWQAANFSAHWSQVTERADYVAGYVYWVLKDYKQRCGYNQEFNGISAMGMLGFDSTTRRVVYDRFRDAELP